MQQFKTDLFRATQLRLFAYVKAAEVQNGQAYGCVWTVTPT